MFNKRVPLLPTFKLPEGYSYATPEQQHILDQQFIPGQPSGYGGATLTNESDVIGNLFPALCASAPEGTPEPRFRFRIWRLERLTGIWTEVTLQRICTGRGSISIDWYYRRLIWCAWNGSIWDRDFVPTAQAFPVPSNGLSANDRVLLDWLAKYRAAVKSTTP